MGYTLHLGDCVGVMRGMADASIDAIVTDPPYGLTAARPGGRSEATRGAVMRGFMGLEWDGNHIAFDPAVWVEALRVLKPGGHLLAFGGSRTYHRLAIAVEDAGFEIRDQIMWIYGSGFPKSHNLDGAWQGWGTALKPAHEPICVARKPLLGTVGANVLAHGTGALNIDGCRVATDEVLRAGAGGIPCRHDEHVPRGRSGEASATRRYANCGTTDFAPLPGPRGGDPAGRWPANVIHDGSDEVLAAFPQAPGQLARARTDGAAQGNAVYGSLAHVTKQPKPRSDTGSAARFFYCAKASRIDRNEGCEHMERKPLHWSSGDQNPGSFQSAATDKASQNSHPTVKPTDLMRYLCRLVTPPGGLVLDPFMGSGSTGKAAILEGFRFIGCELQPEYIDIARARIQHAAAAEQHQYELEIA